MQTWEYEATVKTSAHSESMRRAACLQQSRALALRSKANQELAAFNLSLIHI